MANRHSHGLLYVAFSIYFAFPDFPAAVSTLLCFAEFLLRSFTAAKSVLNALASVRALHTEGGFDTAAFDQPALLKWKRALPFTLRIAPSPSSAPTRGHTCRVLQIRSLFGEKGEGFRSFAVSNFLFDGPHFFPTPVSLTGFDRSRLPCLADVFLEDGRCSLFLKWAKNRQGPEQGFRVPLLPFGAEVACPVRNLTWLLGVLRSAPLSTPLFSFPGHRGSSRGAGRQGFTIRLARTWLSCFNEVLALQGQKYTFHSFRRGACTLAHERGAAVSDLQSLGGWRSEAVTEYFSADSARRRAASCLTLP